VPALLVVDPTVTVMRRIEMRRVNKREKERERERERENGKGVVPVSKQSSVRPPLSTIERGGELEMGTSG
jgi:hypothetical protein